MMYRLVKIFSYLVRQFCMPNPFTNLVTDTGMAEVINWIFGFIFIPLAYFLTSTWYDGETKAIGSLGFFINYGLLTGLFLLITMFVTKIHFVMILFFFCYIALCFAENYLLTSKY